MYAMQAELNRWTATDIVEIRKQFRLFIAFLPFSSLSYFFRMLNSMTDSLVE